MLLPLFLFPPFLVHIGRDAPRRAVGSIIIVLIDQVIQDQARFANRPELPLVQAVIPENAVEALVVPVLPRFSGLDVLGLAYSRGDALFLCPEINIQTKIRQE
jgi:hypothetical protein